jgi:hypothetical protein
VELCTYLTRAAKVLTRNLTQHKFQDFRRMLNLHDTCEYV